ncbi:hypothetical protein D9757_000674 [Collybiopsis confluens]|uniref:Uncharacterized protein n=1 Tax=Collybiopsis confluens TaxID=2823264 RepID=A0A8H5MH12_9AGAR|nr:hypothetical protein D9757_000674 [Collybiopsis confluens]
MATSHTATQSAIYLAAPSTRSHEKITDFKKFRMQKYRSTDEGKVAAPEGDGGK